MTKEQLISKVHREMQDVMEFIAQMHDKLGNGFAALLHAFKKMNPQITDRVRKDLDKRAFQTVSRKLFSIYRFKITNLVVKSPS